MEFSRIRFVKFLLLLPSFSTAVPYHTQPHAHLEKRESPSSQSPDPSTSHMGSPNPKMATVDLDQGNNGHVHSGSNGENNSSAASLTKGTSLSSPGSHKSSLLGSQSDGTSPAAKTSVKGLQMLEQILNTTLSSLPGFEGLATQLQKIIEDQTEDVMEQGKNAPNQPGSKTAVTSGVKGVVNATTNSTVVVQGEVEMNGTDSQGKACETYGYVTLSATTLTTLSGLFESLAKLEKSVSSDGSKKSLSLIQKSRAQVSLTMLSVVRLTATPAVTSCHVPPSQTTFSTRIQANVTMCAKLITQIEKDLKTGRTTAAKSTRVGTDMVISANSTLNQTTGLPGGSPSTLSGNGSPLPSITGEDELSNAPGGAGRHTKTVSLEQFSEVKASFAAVAHVTTGLITSKPSQGKKGIHVGATSTSQVNVNIKSRMAVHSTVIDNFIDQINDGSASKDHRAATSPYFRDKDGLGILQDISGGMISNTSSSAASLSGDMSTDGFFNSEVIPGVSSVFGPILGGAFGTGFKGMGDGSNSNGESGSEGGARNPISDYGEEPSGSGSGTSADLTRSSPTSGSGLGGSRTTQGYPGGYVPGTEETGATPGLAGHEGTTRSDEGSGSPSFGGLGTTEGGSPSFGGSGVSTGGSPSFQGSGTANGSPGGTGMGKSGLGAPNDIMTGVDGGGYPPLGISGIKELGGGGGDPTGTSGASPGSVGGSPFGGDSGSTRSASSCECKFDSATHLRIRSLEDQLDHVHKVMHKRGLTEL